MSNKQILEIGKLLPFFINSSYKNNPIQLVIEFEPEISLKFFWTKKRENTNSGLDSEEKKMQSIYYWIENIKENGIDCGRWVEEDKTNLIICRVLNTEEQLSENKN